MSSESEAAGAPCLRSFRVPCGIGCFPSCGFTRPFPGVRHGRRHRARNGAGSIAGRSCGLAG